jgi:hypothetical protein
MDLVRRLLAKTPADRYASVSSKRPVDRGDAALIGLLIGAIALVFDRLM